MPVGGSIGPIVHRASAVKEAGFDGVPDDLGQFLRLCQALKRNNKPAGFALGNAVGDGNAFANWLVWAHGGYLVDEDGKVAINSRETIAALNYLKELYPTFISGTLGLERRQQQPRLRRRASASSRATASRSTSR